MKTITTTAMLALMTAAIGLSATAPSFARDAPPPAVQGEMQKGPHGGRNDGPGMRGPDDGNGPGMHGQRGDNGPGRGMGGPRGMLDFSNPDSVEIGLVLLSQRIDPTAEQQPLFDTFKTDAMAAATKFQAALEAARPAAPAAGEQRVRPDFAEMLDNRIAVTTAELEALQAVQPSAKAFFDSLSDEQKTALAPMRPDRADSRRGGPDRRPAGAPPAPEDATAPADAPASTDAPMPAEAPMAPATNG